MTDFETIGDLLADINHGDPQMVILRGHLWVEHEMNALLRGDFVHPEHVQLDRLSFDHRVRLAVARGLIPESQLPAIRVLNKIRNQLAHGLAWEFRLEHANELLAVTGRDLVNEGQALNGLREAIVRILAQVTIARLHQGGVPLDDTAEQVLFRRFGL